MFFCLTIWVFYFKINCSIDWAVLYFTSEFLVFQYKCCSITSSPLFFLDNFSTNTWRERFKSLAVGTGINSSDLKNSRGRLLLKRFLPCRFKIFWICSTILNFSSDDCDCQYDPCNSCNLVNDSFETLFERRRHGRNFDGAPSSLINSRTSSVLTVIKSPISKSPDAIFDDSVHYRRISRLAILISAAWWR